MPAIQFAIIGAGNIGRVHALAISAIPDASLKLIYDIQPAVAEKLAREFRVDWVRDLAAILENPAIDVVCICTPSGQHAAVAIPVAQHHKHLLIEKPLEITLAKIDQICATVRQAGVRLACIFPLRFRVGIQQAYTAIRQGRLGKLIFIQGNVKWYRPPVYYAGSWRGTWELDGGGALMNQAIHTIDLMQWFGGAVRQVFAKTARRYHQIETEDTATALLDFENGAQGVIQAATNCWPGDAARLEIHGHQGTIVLEEGRITRWQLLDATQAEANEMLSTDVDTSGGAQDPGGIHFQYHQRQIMDLIQAIRESRPPMIGGDEARKSVAIILAIYQSAQLEQPVRLDD
ncbi:Gfo/Idh/MocA family oxidoreductase [candidate division KSB1 bacterium]|nr:Gfo/Idh/MocA family oxidoreductase [candidate division KSB1 bacterium]